MDRQELSDAVWERIAPHLPGKATDPGRTGRDNRLFVEAILWLARSGAHWRVLPKEFGRWHTVYQRFNRWCRSGVWESLCKALSNDADFEYILVDSTIVRAHPPRYGRYRSGGCETCRPASNHNRQLAYLRCRNLQGPQPDQALLQQDQTLPPHRHTIRQARQKLRWLPQPRRRTQMLPINVNTT
jgi:putative transposase